MGTEPWGWGHGDSSVGDDHPAMETLRVLEDDNSLLPVISYWWQHPSLVPVNLPVGINGAVRSAGAPAPEPPGEGAGLPLNLLIPFIRVPDKQRHRANCLGLGPLPSLSCCKSQSSCGRLQGLLLEHNIQSPPEATTTYAGPGSGATADFSLAHPITGVPGRAVRGRAPPGTSGGRRERLPRAAVPLLRRSGLCSQPRSGRCSPSLPSPWSCSGGFTAARGNRGIKHIS